MPQVIHREVVQPPIAGRCVFPGFVTYIDRDKPTLMMRRGWVDGSDQYDDFADCFSTDNGQTWNTPRIALQGRRTGPGRERYAENTCFFDTRTGLLHTFVTHAVYHEDGHAVGLNRWQIEMNTYDPAHDRWGTPTRTDMGLPHGLSMSFSFPIELPTGQVLVPVQRQRLDDQGRFVFLPGYDKPQLQAAVLIGRRDNQQGFTWRLGQFATIDPQLSSRGLCEPAIAPLRDGRVAMICRGDNGHFPEKPGHKWLCFSHDHGQSWSDPAPLTLADGQPIESGAAGSALFRSTHDGELYWLGNPALDGRRAQGNWPRSPLVLARVQEEPFGLVRDSFVTIDTRRPGESEHVQHSNFRFYQDRQNHDLVIFLTRFGEVSHERFKDAGHYRYRVRMA